MEERPVPVTLHGHAPIFINSTTWSGPDHCNMRENCSLEKGYSEL